MLLRNLPHFIINYCFFILITLFKKIQSRTFLTKESGPKYIFFLICLRAKRAAEP